MMKSIGWVFFSVMLAGMVGCTSLWNMEQPRLSVADIAVRESSLFEQKLGVTLRITNPNKVELPISALAYDIEVNGQPFATGLSNKKVVVPAYGSALVEVEAISNVASIVRQLANIAKPDGLHFKYLIKGHVVAGASEVRLPFTYSGEWAPLAGSSGKS